MGGMHGFGAVRPEACEPVFHAPWEGRVFALYIAMGVWDGWNIDSGRHHLECLPPVDYLRLSYYERWLASLEGLGLAKGLFRADELAAGRGDPAAPPVGVRPLVAAAVPHAVARGAPTVRDAQVAPCFAVGARVRARNLHPVGHTRLPRYVRGRVGTIVHDHGAHVFPDAHAHGFGERPQRLYTVRFAARELWGAEANAADSVALDLWDPYLDPEGAA